MERKSFTEMDCSIAQCLEVVGEWWTLLVVRDVFLGVRRFDDMQRHLGVSRNILQQRLEKLVGTGILERVAYCERPPRFEYRLTGKGRDLWPVITAMRQWGDQYAAPEGPPIGIVHTACGTESEPVYVCGSCAEQVSAGDYTVVRHRDSAAAVAMAHR